MQNGLKSFSSISADISRRNLGFNFSQVANRITGKLWRSRESCALSVSPARRVFHSFCRSKQEGSEPFGVKEWNFKSIHSTACMSLSQQICFKFQAKRAENALLGNL